MYINDPFYRVKFSWVLAQFFTFETLDYAHVANSNTFASKL